LAAALSFGFLVVVNMSDNIELTPSPLSIDSFTETALGNAQQFIYVSRFFFPKTISAEKKSRRIM
jgi:hypothetical protein